MIPIWVIGAGGHAKVVIDTARASGTFQVVGCLDDDPARLGESVLEVPVLGSITNAAVRELRVSHAVIAIGSNSVRHQVATMLGGAIVWPTLVHPGATVAASAVIGDGSVVCAGAVVQAEAVVGNHAIVNTASSIDHDSHVCDFAHVGPGAHIAAACVVEKGAFLGVGSSVIPGIRVGEWAVAGAGAVLIRNVPSKATVVGVPARTLR